MDVLGVKIIVLILIAAFKLVSGVAPMFLFPRLRKGGAKKKKLDKVTSKYWTQSFIQYPSLKEQYYFNQHKD